MEYFGLEIPKSFFNIIKISMIFKILFIMSKINKKLL